MKKYTACFAESGSWWHEGADQATFNTLEDLRKDVLGLPIEIISDPHQVSLGSVEVDDDGEIDWSSWETLDTVWAGDLTNGD
jgi:hypothetical protein